MMLPDGFCSVTDKRIIIQINYATHDNFMGRPAAGYQKTACILSIPAAQALLRVQDELDAIDKGFHLKIFDAYRPTRAVSDFIEWTKDDSDQKMKSIFYPNLEKEHLFKLGYLVEQSSHSRGSTVDLTISKIDNAQPLGLDLDMGTIFDYFDPKANTEFYHLSEQQKQNRQFLKNIMANHGFTNYPLEWWHFTFHPEPFPNTYFDFLVD